MEGDFRIDQWLVQPRLNTVVSPENAAIQLEPKVMEVLVYLADRAGEVVPKENLLQALWGDTFVTENALTRCIAELRKAFQDHAEVPRIIQTITKRGYRLIASVSKLKAAACRYEILEKLGQGAMGEVFLAKDTELQRKVALKFVLEEKGPDETSRKRLLREARAAAALDHPFICKIFDTGDINGKTFIAMEHVEGQVLKQKLTRGRLEMKEALTIGWEIAEALESAHDKGIVHRDLKPSNIMITPQGHVKVMDFGLAKRLPQADMSASLEDSLSALAGEGTTAGTLPYMSPEQLRAETIDSRSDIFSFGIVLFEMIAGTHPFEKKSAVETAAAILDNEPDWSRLPTDTPALIRALLRRCLQKDTGRRQHYLADVRIEIDDSLRHRDTDETARRGRVREARAAAGQASRLPFRWGWTVVFAAVAVVLVATGWFWFGRFRSPVAEAPVTAVPLTTIPGSEMSPFFSPEGNHLAFAWNGEKENNFDIYVQMIGSGRPLRLTTDPATDSAPAWSPDGKQIAFLRELSPSKRAVLLVPPLGGSERRLAELNIARGGVELGTATLAWHPGGKHLAVEDAGALFLLSTETGEKRRLTTPPLARVHRNPAFSPDGRSLAFSQGDFYGADLYLLSLDHRISPTGEPTRLTTGMARAAFPVWTADGREIVFSSGFVLADSLWRMAVTGQGKPQRLAVAGEGAWQPALTRDGRRLAYSRLALDTNIYRIQVSADGTAEGRPARLIASSRYEYLPRFSPDGSKIAFDSDRSGVPEIWVCDSDGANPVQVTSAMAPDTEGPHWSPDGQEICYSASPEGQADIFVVRGTGGKPRRLTMNPAQDRAASWSRDGQWIYFSSDRGGSKQIWKLPAASTSLPEEAIQVTQNGGNWPFESHDGKLVYYYKSNGVWQVPVAGGEETQLIESVWDWSILAVSDKGIYFIPRVEAAVRFFDFNTGAIRTVTTLNGLMPSNIAVSPDGRTILYVQYDTYNSDLMLVENFR